LGQIDSIINDYHRDFPLRLGIPREELRSRIGLKNALLTILLEVQEHIVSNNNLLKISSHEIRFSQKQEKAIEQLAQTMQSTPYTPPSFKEASDIVGEDVLYALIDLGEIVLVQADVIFSRGVYDEMIAGVLRLIEKNGDIDAKVVRDHFGTSRKYAIGLLEHLDNIGITKRVGDVRVKGAKA
jgi:selenocysteine-specific elongation factor